MHSHKFALSNIERMAAGKKTTTTVLLNRMNDGCFFFCFIKSPVSTGFKAHVEAFYLVCKRPYRNVIDTALCVLA